MFQRKFVQIIFSKLFDHLPTQNFTRVRMIIYSYLRSERICLVYPSYLESFLTSNCIEQCGIIFKLKLKIKIKNLIKERRKILMIIWQKTWQILFICHIDSSFISKFWLVFISNDPYSLNYYPQAFRSLSFCLPFFDQLMITIQHCFCKALNTYDFFL